MRIGVMCATFFGVTGVRTGVLVVSAVLELRFIVGVDMELADIDPGRDGVAGSPFWFLEILFTAPQLKATTISCQLPKEKRRNLTDLPHRTRGEPAGNLKRVWHWPHRPCSTVPSRETAAGGVTLSEKEMPSALIQQVK